MTVRETLWVILDCVAAAALFALSARGVATPAPNFGLPGWVTISAAVPVAVPVAVRRLWPGAAFAVALAAYGFEAAAGVSNNPAVAVALCLYSVAVVSRPPRRSAPQASIAIAIAVTAELAGIAASRQPVAWPTGLDFGAATVAVLAAAWAAGAARGLQLRYEARAAQQATSRAVADERLRIARELHDVITHSMSLITVKASVANYLIESRPQEVRATLTLIEATGREALTEMRRMLGVLRADGDHPAYDALDERAPAPGLAELTALAEHAAQAGVHVDLDAPADRDLPEGVALAAYRIVQEALTNVAKHAAPTRCRVRVCRTGGDVLIDVTDDGPSRTSRPVAAGGHGIIGMRERAALFGGELEAGPGPHGGFRVTARLPCAAGAPGGFPAAFPAGFPSAADGRYLG
jgi:signal transduction histidine kinase